MGSTEIAIIVGSIIIALAISSLKKDDKKYEDYYPPSSTSYKIHAIDEGSRKGLTAKEIFAKNKDHFSSVEDVDKHIDQYKLREEFDEIEELRKQNPKKS